jgi:methyl coenzyme M reductase alpha subunit
MSMKNIFLLWAFLSTIIANADESRVVDVRRNITLSDDDKIYRDFYISGGTELGYKKGQTLTATRKIAVKDATRSTNIGEITIPVGDLKIIAVYDKVSVARLVKLLERDELPMLEQRGIMTGDTVAIKK